MPPESMPPEREPEVPDRAKDEVEEEEAEEEEEEEYVPLLEPRDATERELALNLLEAAGIRRTMVDSDRLELLHVLGGELADGLQFIVVSKDDFERAVGVLREAWGDEALEGRITPP